MTIYEAMGISLKSGELKNVAFYLDIVRRLRARNKVKDYSGHIHNKKTWNLTEDEGVALLATFTDEIRRECGDRGVEWLHSKAAIYNRSLKDGMKRKEQDDSLRAAIEGKEKS